VICLGYVVIPGTVEFNKEQEIIGYDIDQDSIDGLNNGIDSTNEVTEEDLKATSITFTAEPADLKQVDFIIVAVPTPITENKQPDLTPLLKASETVGSNISKGTIVVYES